MQGPALALTTLLCAFAVGLSGTDPSQVETGVASWYGPNFHGRAAASGEIYDAETLVAAHPTLPFNTRVRVINLENWRSVEVRIMDRGPFVPGRIIDLSHAAAREIGMIAPGTVPVRVEVIRLPEAIETADRYAVQVGAFANRDTAEQLRAAMQAEFGVARIMQVVKDSVLYRVWVGSEASEQDARSLAERVRQRPETRRAFVVRPDA